MTARAWNRTAIAFGVLAVAALAGLHRHSGTTLGAVCGLTLVGSILGTFLCAVAAAYENDMP